MPGQWVVHDDYGVARYLGAEQVKTADGEQEYLVLQFAEERRLLIPVMQFHKISPWSPLPGAGAGGRQAQGLALEKICGEGARGRREAPQS